MIVPRVEIGSWYRQGEGESFEVVAHDRDDGTIEIQYFDGTLEEMEFEDWRTSMDAGALIQVEAPEDWTGAVDADLDDDDTAVRAVPSMDPAMDNENLQRASPFEDLDPFE